MALYDIPQNTISCPIPDNITPLSPNGFMFNISKLPSVSYFCQQVNLPGVTLGSPEQLTPLSVLPIPGEMLSYDTLQVQFLIDSEMANYKAIYNWLKGLGFPQDNAQYSDWQRQDNLQFSELAKNYSDGSLSILTGTNNVSQQIQFVDLFPISIGSIVFQSTNSDVQYLVGDASFKYSYYKFL
jgi:hypothetical protein